MVTYNEVGATYGDLVNGDHIYIEGYLVKVQNLRMVVASDGQIVVRFNGHSPDLPITYDGEVYGGILSRPVTIIRYPDIHADPEG